VYEVHGETRILRGRPSTYSAKELGEVGTHY
jgi:hypothetical protein